VPPDRKNRDAYKGGRVAGSLLSRKKRGGGENFHPQDRRKTLPRIFPLVEKGRDLIVRHGKKGKEKRKKANRIRSPTEEKILKRARDKQPSKKDSQGKNREKALGKWGGETAPARGLTLRGGQETVGKKGEIHPPHEMELSTKKKRP